MKKNDIKLGAVILAAAFVLLILGKVMQKEGSTVVIYVEGKEYGRYSLEEDAAININGTNRLRIEGHKADMTEADCPDKLCVHQKAAKAAGESIICLPNRIVVQIEGGSEGSLDGVTF